MFETAKTHEQTCYIKEAEEDEWTTLIKKHVDRNITTARMLQQLLNITGNTTTGTAWSEEASELWGAIKRKLGDNLEPHVITTLDRRRNTTGAIWCMQHNIHKLKKMPPRKRQNNKRKTKTKQLEQRLATGPQAEKEAYALVRNPWHKA